MKYCGACGTPVEDDCLFCPNCGQRLEERIDPVPEPEPYVANEPVQEPEPEPAAYEPNVFEEEETPVQPAPEEPSLPGKKKGIPKLAFIIAGAAAAIALVVVLIFTGVFSGLLPHSKLKLKYAEQKLFKELTAAANTGVSEVQDIDMAYELTMKAVAASDSYYSNTETADIMNKLTVSGGGDMDKNGGNYSVVAEYKGNELIDFRCFLEKERLSVYLSPLSDELYTCDIKEMLETLADELNLDLDEGPDQLRDMDLAKKDAEKITKIIFKHLLNGDVKISKGKTVRLFDEEETVKGAAVYQISLSEKQWKALLTELVSYAEDKDSYVYSLIDAYVVYLKQQYSYYYKDIEDAADVIDQWKDQIPEAAETLADQDLKFEVVMKGNTIIRQRVFTDDGGAGYDLLTSGKEVHFAFYTEEEMLLDLQAERSGSKLDIEATVFADGEKIRITGSDIKLNKRSQLGIPQGEYSMSFDGNRVSLNVTPEGKGMQHELRIRFDQSYRYRSFDSLTFTLYTEKGAKIAKPKGVDTVDISDYSLNELEKLAEKLYSKFSSSVLPKLSK